jgi:hypothetical protein
MNCPQGTLFQKFGFIGISQPLVLFIAREYCEIESRNKKLQRPYLVALPRAKMRTKH